MSKILVKTYDEEFPELLGGRVEEAVRPELEKLDTVNKQYLITVEITELP